MNYYPFKWMFYILVSVLIFGLITPLSMGGSHTYSKVPTKDKEFRGAGGGALGCFTINSAPETYLPCLQIGPFHIGQSRQDVEKILGKSVKTYSSKGKTTSEVYVLDGTRERLSYFVVTYNDLITAALQLTGAGTNHKYAFSSIKLGDKEEWVIQVLGNPRSKKEVQEVQAIIWDYSPYPISLEIKGGKVISLRISRGAG